MSHLLVTNDFPPKVGGIQSYLWELWRRLEPDSFTVLTTPHDGAAAWEVLDREDAPRLAIIPERRKRGQGNAATERARTCRAGVGRAGRDDRAGCGGGAAEWAGFGRGATRYRARVRIVVSREIC